MYLKVGIIFVWMFKFYKNKGVDKIKGINWDLFFFIKIVNDFEFSIKVYYGFLLFGFFYCFWLLVLILGEWSRRKLIN